MKKPVQLGKLPAKPYPRHKTTTIVGPRRPGAPPQPTAPAQPVGTPKPASTALPESAVPPPPTTINWYSNVTNWPIYDNDVIGDCVEAAAGHYIECQVTYANPPLSGQGVPADSSIDAFYELAAAPPGWQPPVDASNPGPGTYIPTAMNDWLTNGIGGDQPIAFQAIAANTQPGNYWNREGIQAAIAIYGALLIGVSLPLTAEAQWDADEPWDVTVPFGPAPNPTNANPEVGTWGGHCVILVGMDTETINGISQTVYYCITWGTLWKMTDEFFWRYSDAEYYVAVSNDWINKSTRLSPNGYDIPTLLAYAKGVPSPASVIDVIHGLYSVLFGVLATAAGVTYWVNFVANVLGGVTQANASSTAITTAAAVALAQQMVTDQSAYFLTEFPSTMPDAQFASNLYTTLGGNPVSNTAAIQYWLAQIQAAEQTESQMLARASVAAQFVMALLNNDLTIGAAALGLTAADYAAVVNDQWGMCNKRDASEYFALLISGGGFVNGVYNANAGLIFNYTTESGPAWQAAQTLAAYITFDQKTLVTAENAMDAALAAQSLAPITAL